MRISDIATSKRPRTSLVEILSCGKRGSFRGGGEKEGMREHVRDRRCGPEGDRRKWINNRKGEAMMRMVWVTERKRGRATSRHRCGAVECGGAA